MILIFKKLISLKNLFNVKRLEKTGFYCCIITTLLEIIAIPVYYKALNWQKI
jgi:hypothetical protein